MQAFHNDVKVKEKYVARVLAHQAADNIIQGTGWENGKGCAVGCTLENYSHSAYEKELGVPLWLANLKDRIFEGLENSEAKLFPANFLQAINVGADLDKVKIPFLIFVLESARDKTTNKQSLAAIDGVLVELKKDVIDKEKLLIARRAAAAAYAAAYVAAYAAYAADAAAAAAYAAEAAYAAAAAAYAAEAAAVAAEAAAVAADAADAADAAARKTEYKKFADKLIELLKECI